MDEEKFKEEATALLEMARDLSKKSGKDIDLYVNSEGRGWLSTDDEMEDINIGFENI